jgi:hypothetical protein
MIYKIFFLITLSTLCLIGCSSDYRPRAVDVFSSGKKDDLLVGGFSIASLMVDEEPNDDEHSIPAAGTDMSLGGSLSWEHRSSPFSLAAGTYYDFPLNMGAFVAVKCYESSLLTGGDLIHGFSFIELSQNLWDFNLSGNIQLKNFYYASQNNGFAPTSFSQGRYVEKYVSLGYMFTPEVQMYLDVGYLLPNAETVRVGFSARGF